MIEKTKEKNNLYHVFKYLKEQNRLYRTLNNKLVKTMCSKNIKEN